MFDQLFRRVRLCGVISIAPLLQERLEYLRYCASQGYALTTLRVLASDLLLIQNLFGLATSSDFIPRTSCPGGSEPMGPPSTPAF